MRSVREARRLKEEEEDEEDKEKEEEKEEEEGRCKPDLFVDSEMVFHKQFLYFSQLLHKHNFIQNVGEILKLITRDEKKFLYI